MDRSGIVYLTQEEFSQLDISAIDKILNGIHVHRSRLDGQEVFAMQARAVLTYGRNKPPEPAPRPRPASANEDASAGDDSGSNDDARSDDGGSDGGCGHDPGAARSKREMRDAERRAARLADFPEIADALAAGEISTEQADLISRARLSTRIKLELLTDAKHEHADQTAEAVKVAVREADSESADDRLNRQRGNRRGGCGVNDDGMYWLSLLIDPVTGARIKHAYDPRFRAAWATEKQLDHTERRQPKQVAGDVIANMLLGLPAVYDLHPQAQADAHHQPEPESAPEPRCEREPASSSSASGRPSPSPWMEPAFGFDSLSEPVPATTNTLPNPGVRFVEIGKDADGNETRTDLGSYTPIRPAPLFNTAPGPTQSDRVGLDPPDSDRTCPTCRSSGSPPPVNTNPRPRAEVSVVIGLSDLNALDDRQAIGFTADGVPMPATVVRALLCDADISYWIEQADSQQLKLARTVRYATPIQRQALLVRDGGCVWKHCTMPASASEAHHITFWEHGGTTDLEHLCLLCPAHHRKLHAMGAHIRPGPKQREWYLTRDSDGQTIKEWTNPPHRQKPGHHAA